MYEITLNDQTLYHPNSPECSIISAVLHEKLNDAGYLELCIPFSNPMYDEIHERHGKIALYKDNNPTWYGEVRDVSVDFSKNKTVYIVGEASYLNDTVQPQRQYEDTKRNILTEFINNHNAMVEDNKKFSVGIISNNGNKTMKVVTDWSYTLDAIREHLCEDEEYFRIRHVNGERFIDIMQLEDYGKRSEQVIMFGDNMLDYAEESSGADIATVCIPLGVKLEESAVEGVDSYLTCETANGGKNYVLIQSAIDRLGYITKVVHFNVLNTPEALVTAAINYLQNSQYAKLTLNLSAIDLSILESDIESYYVGDYVRTICEPLNMDVWLPIRERETDLINIANNSIKIGAVGTKGITTQNIESIGELKQEMPNKDSILAAAKKNATALINGAGDNGHVVFHTNENGVVYEILIMDTADINTARKIWRWNENGFGYSKDGGKNYGLAMTMDGSIVADYITSGTMNCDRLNGGAISGQTISGGTISGGTITGSTFKNASETFEISSSGVLTAKSSKGTVSINNGMLSVNVVDDAWFHISKGDYELDLSPTKWGLKSKFYNGQWGWIWLDPAEVFKYLSEKGLGA